MKRIRSQQLNEIATIKAQILHCLSQVELEVNEFYSSSETDLTMLPKPSTRPKGNISELDENDSLEVVSDKVGLMIRATKENRRQETAVKEKLATQRRKIEEFSSVLLAKLEEVIQQTCLRVESISKSLKRGLPLREHGFSTSLKHPDIEVSATTVQSKRVQNTTPPQFGRVCVLGATPMHPATGRLYRCHMKLASMFNRICVGVMLEKHALQSRYTEQVSWKALENGLYLNASNGYVYSHSDLEVHYKQRGITYEVGDTIEL